MPKTICIIIRRKLKEMLKWIWKQAPVQRNCDENGRKQLNALMKYLKPVLFPFQNVIILIVYFWVKLKQWRRRSSKTNQFLHLGTLFLARMRNSWHFRVFVVKMKYFAMCIAKSTTTLSSSSSTTYAKGTRKHCKTCMYECHGSC